MLFSRAVLIACLTVFRALLWLTGGLLLALTVVQAVRGDPDRRPEVTAPLGVVMIGAGQVCRMIARRIEKSA